MPPYSALIAALIVDRPLCLDCITRKSGVDMVAVKGYLREIERLGLISHESDRCRACGVVGKVVSMHRPL
jgi:predicted transcriptional regulator